MKVVVVGAGIAGLCCAYYLRKLEAEVTVVDSQPVGSPVASSYGNGGWICPAQAGPLPEPGLTSHGVRALLARDSALYFRPGYLPRLVPWLARFRTYCNRRDHEAGTAALAGLGRRVFHLVDEMAEDGIEAEIYKLGMICATADERAARKVLDGLQGMRRHGYTLPEELLIGDELHAVEPALSERVRAGFYLSEQWHVRPTTMTLGIAARLRDQGVEIRERVRVEGFDVADGTVRAAITSAGELSADAFVLAAGSWTTPLARTIGVRLPMQPGKGYSFLLTPKVMPRHGILFADIHAGATPLGDRLRIGGTMEFSGFDRTIDRRRVDTVFHLARDYIELERPDYEEAWAGLRPMTVDGLPIADRSPRHANAFIATGYSMLGMTLAQPAGEALAQFLTTGERPPVLVPFQADRFRRRLL